MRRDGSSRSVHPNSLSLAAMRFSSSTVRMPGEIPSALSLIAAAVSFCRNSSGRSPPYDADLLASALAQACADVEPARVANDAAVSRRKSFNLICLDMRMPTCWVKDLGRWKPSR